MLHMPPVGVLWGTRCMLVAFHASLTIVFWMLRPNCPNCPGLIVAGPVFVSTRLGAEVSPIAIETLALDVRVGVFQVTSAVFVRIEPAGIPAEICTRKRTSRACAGCSGAFIAEWFAVSAVPGTVTRAGARFVVGAGGFRNVSGPRAALR